MLPAATMSSPDQPIVSRLDALRQKIFPQNRLAPRNWRYLIASNTAQVILLSQQGQDLGFGILLYRANSTKARLYIMGIDAAYRRGGMGRFLLEQAEYLAIAQSRNSITLEVDENNIAATWLYEQAGYRILRYLPHYYHNGATALYMVKPLC